MQIRLRIALFIGILLVVCVLGIVAFKSRQSVTNVADPSAKAQQPAPLPGGMRWYAQRSAANGETAFSIMLAPRTPRATDLNQALANYGVAVAELLNQESVWYDPPDAIYTWYKFRVAESLTTKPYIPCPSCTFSPTPPASMLPLQSGEILVPMLGGSAVVDDVAIEPTIEDFDGLVTGQRYLLFLNLSSTQVGKVPIGPQGILHINSDNAFSPVLMLAPGETEPIIHGLATQYGNSLTQLRAALNPSPPSGRLLI